MSLEQPFPQGSNIIADIPTVDISFDEEAFDRTIRSQGVRVEHLRALRCPIGMIEKGDYRAPGHGAEHADHKCHNGFLYRSAGTVYASFLGNSKNSKIADIGRIDGSTVTSSMTRFYEGTETPVTLAVFDRIKLADKHDITVVNWEVIETHPTGTDRLRFPAVEVEFVIDANGKEYTQGQDFRLVDGDIRWINSPGYDPRLRKGVLYSVRYKYEPFYYVAQLIHEVRVAQKENKYTGERKIKRMPYNVVLKREINFENDRAAEEVVGVPDTPSIRPAPTTFGPR